MKGALCLSVWLSLVWGSACAETLPAPGAGDPRIRWASYSPDEVYRLYAAVGYDLRLEFGGQEQFVSIDGGDLEAITYSAQGNVFSFKPRAALADTNFAITTTQHSYYFRYSTLSAHEADPTTRPIMYVVRFQYPHDRPENSAQRAEAGIDRALAEASAQHPLNTDYWFCGPPSLKPLAAFDDGVHTRLRFQPRGEWPAVFVRNGDGSESLLNFTVESGDLVIHRIAPQFVLRRGRSVGCIVNKGFVGEGTRLDSGTVSQAVQRHTQGVHP